MKLIKYILFLLLIPFVTQGQTVHIDNDKIVYKGTIKLEQVNKEDLYIRAKNALIKNVKGNKKLMGEANIEKEKIAAEGSIKLSSPYHIIKTVEYILELSVEDGKYKYLIDSVYIKQAERGGKTTKTSSEDLLKDMDVSGPVSANAEKQLNEIDMHFQKLLYLINADMKKTAV
ncbi:MAG: DUF4468 domain-containing protein, partial [Bacteroidia bacterium]|nr:DUF4468 domain-containing protein [Bacteroidia bacterium]